MLILRLGHQPHPGFPWQYHLCPYAVRAGENVSMHKTLRVVVQTSVCDCARVQGQQCVSSILCLKVPGCASSSVLLGLATGTLYLIDQMALAHLLYSPGCAYRYKQEASPLCRRHVQLWCKNTVKRNLCPIGQLCSCVYSTEGRGWWLLEMRHGLSTGVLGSRPSIPLEAVGYPKGIFLANVQPGVQQEPQGLFCKVAFWHVSPQHCTDVVVPTQTPDIVLLSMKCMRPLNSISPFLQLVQVSLGGSWTLWHISHSLGIPQYRRTQGLGLQKISIYYRSPQITTSK